LREKIEERFVFPDLIKIFKVKEGEIEDYNLRSHFPRGFNNLEMHSRKPFGWLKQDITFKDGRKFSRIVNVRWDASGHGKHGPHLNIDLISTYHRPSDKNEECPKLKECHLIEIGKIGSQPIHILLSVPGESIRETVILLPTSEDKEYIKKENEFLTKMRQKKLTKKNEIKFKKTFDNHVELLEKEGEIKRYQDKKFKTIVNREIQENIKK